MRANDKSRSLVIWVGVLFLAFSALIGWAPLNAAEVNYAGKVLTIVTEDSPGAGSDIMGRLLSRHLPKFLPGNPSAVVRNIVGAAGTQGPNYMYNRAKPDGLTIQCGSLVSLTNNIFRPAAVKYQYRDMPCIFGYLAGNILVVKPQIALKPTDLMNAKGLIFGHVAPAGSSAALMFTLAKELIGFPAEKMIWGYTPSQSRLAFIQGELTCYAESILGYRQSMLGYVEKGDAVPILQSGILDVKGNVVRDRMGPDVPTISELYEQVHGKKPSGPLWEACKTVMIGSRAFSKYLLYPPKTPENILAVGRKSIRQMFNDKEFMNEAQKVSPGDYIFTEDAPGVWESVVAPPVEVVNFMKKMYTEKYGVQWD